MSVFTVKEPLKHHLPYARYVIKRFRIINDINRLFHKFILFNGHIKFLNDFDLMNSRPVICILLFTSEIKISCECCKQWA